MFLGCASNFESRSGIKVNQSVMKNRNSLAGWLSYGMALAAWKPVNDTSGKLNFYEREVYARESTALIWQDLKKDGKKLPDPDLDALVLITKSGFIREYVWVFLRQPNWILPDGLKLHKFTDWIKTNLPNHKPVINPGVSLE